jgi:hypothetical protein
MKIFYSNPQEALQALLKNIYLKLVPFCCGDTNKKYSKNKQTPMICGKS